MKRTILMAVTSAAFVGQNDVIVVGEGGLILRSEDGGATWNAAVTPTTSVEAPLTGLGGAPDATPADVSPAPGVP